jgi:MFS family permease
VIIDRAGTRRTVLLFGAIASTGGVVIVLSPGYRGMVAGRVLLGLGSEPLCVAVTTALAKWFRAGELSFAMALSLTIARLGSVAADNSRAWAGGLFTSWRPPLALAAAIGGLALACGAVYWMLEARAARRFALGSAAPTDRLVLRDLVRFDRSYLWVVGLCVTFYSTIFPFRRFANIFLAHARGVPAKQAGFLNGLLPLTAMVATPLFGLLADRVGRRSLLMALGALLLAPTFLMLAHTSLPVPVPMAMIGVSFSLIPAVMWPSVAYLVDEARLGTAYALMTLCQQLGWAAVAWAVGWLNDAAGASAAHPSGYAPGLWLLSALALFGLLFSWLLWRQETGPGARGLETIRS